MTKEFLDDEKIDHYYWPDGLVPITPQARHFGFVMDVHVTPRVWKDTCVWTAGRGTHTDKRIIELLQACYQGLGKALAKQDDMLYFKFKHWFKHRGQPRAKKHVKAKLAARLLLHPGTGEPWLLIFHPDRDTCALLKKGEPPDGKSEEHREDEARTGEPRMGDDTGLDQGSS